MEKWITIPADITRFLEITPDPAITETGIADMAQILARADTEPPE